MNLKPWREIVSPHKNVLEGTFQESEFAADLYKVANGTAEPEYQDPKLFFERTYITEGMKLMLESVAKRISGNGGDPVVQLQTAFGGGKTHAMLAVYHISKGEEDAVSLPGVYSILSGMGITDLPSAHIAVLDGNSLSPSQPRKRGSISINTLWGEMAWQIGGEEGYHMVEAADRDGTSPGKEILADLFGRFSPTIILMDEVVAYIRQFAGEARYPGGTFDSNLTFLQTLTEAVGHVNNAMLIASLPESDLEVGGERGKQALSQIQHLFHRVEAIWKPVSSEEGFEIVRRRIFSQAIDSENRKAVCRAYADMYIKDDNYPSMTRESGYFERLLTSYPIHPEVFDRLYEDWATMANFQRTRGVLRLMAMVVHRLWVDGNQDLMIMPSSLPLYDNTVKSELLRYLPTGWDPVMERDIDGDKAMTTETDQQDTRFGVVQAARRVARSIFLGSAPTGISQRIRGLDPGHIRLGCTQPEQSSGIFDDVLRRLIEKLYYLYAGKERYWFDTQTNLRREAEDRMNRFSYASDQAPEISRRLKSMLKGDPFTGIHIFTSHGDIPDDNNIRLVVLPPQASHLWKKKETKAIQAAEIILRNRGQQPRLNQNRLIFLCADQDTKSAVYDQSKRYMAWKSIIDDKDSLNLDQHRLKEARQNIEDYNNRLNGALREAYKWLLAPYQKAAGKGVVNSLEWETEKISPTGDNMVPTITQTLADNEMLINNWSPFHLKNELEKWYFKDDRKNYGLLNLWNDFCRYPYLPRLIDSTVLQATVTAGIQSNDFFGYATGVEEDRYMGLVFDAKGSVFLDNSSVIVNKEAAIKQQENEKKSETGTEDPGAGNANGVDYNEIGDTGRKPGGIGETQPTESSVKLKKRRFYGSVKLDPVSAPLTFSDITQEVIQHFSSQLGTTVSITLEIEAENDNGFSESLCRTVNENSKTLGFNSAEFEDE
ncbi:MAG: DUF499 domain-containing protein [Pseudomonadota bacterium]|nr:DUF499 domain-containing protein [Pseudomonadota bacterium]